MDEEAKKKVKIVSHFNHYGLDSIKDAFGISKASIYRWKRIIKTLKKVIQNFLKNQGDL